MPTNRVRLYLDILRQARKAGGARMLPAWQRDGLSGVTGFSSRSELGSNGRPGSSGSAMSKP
eukprot:COSAG05_NODE_13333_length_434_cov_0.767164_1_plen_61_part_10